MFLICLNIRKWIDSSTSAISTSCFRYVIPSEMFICHFCWVQYECILVSSRPYLWLFVFLVNESRGGMGWGCLQEGWEQVGTPKCYLWRQRFLEDWLLIWTPNLAKLSFIEGYLFVRTSDSSRQKAGGAVAMATRPLLICFSIIAGHRKCFNKFLQLSQKQLTKRLLFRGYLATQLVRFSAYLLWNS